MRALIQRVTRGSVTVGGQVVGAINAGLVVLLGVGPADTPAEARLLAGKIVHLRIFSDAQGKFNLSLLEVGGGVLAVSQFTLYADARKGRRPGFSGAARPELAAPLFDEFVACLRGLGVAPVATGVFGAHMDVEIHNDGPVTLWLDTADLAALE